MLGCLFQFRLLRLAVIVVIAKVDALLSAGVRCLIFSDHEIMRDGLVMKIDFLPDGSPDCPLIRLSDFDTLQACHLRELILSLTEETSPEVLLQEALWAQTVNLRSFVLQVSEVDQGIVQGSGNGVFLCRLNCSSWQSVADLILPFCSDSRAGTYQWLDETSVISLLLSPNGSW